MPKLLITGSSTPDIDAAACAIGYQSYLSQKDPHNSYIAGVYDGMHPEASFICENVWLSVHNIDANEVYDGYILVDASETHGLPPILDFAKVQEVIDHRLFPDYAAFPHAKFRIEPVGAAATQIAEFFYFDQNITLSPAIAQLLLCAIYSNTINFKANVTSFRDERMKNWLSEIVDNPMLFEKMFAHKTQYILENLQEVMYAEDKTVDTQLKLFQLELYDATQLYTRYDELVAIMQDLSTDVPSAITIIQDIKYGTTSLIPTNTISHEHIQSAKLPGWWKDGIRIIPSIMMRKTLIPYLRK